MTSARRRTKSLSERFCLFRANAGDGFPIVGFRGEYAREAAEASEESTRRNRGNSWNRGEYCLGCVGTRFCFWTLCVWRSVTSRSVLSPLGESVQPKRGVKGIGRAKHRDPEITQCKTCSPRRSGREWPIVEITSFDEQIREACSPTKPTELRPECACDDSCMHSTHGFALDECATPATGSRPH
jgi:hypothetical protein